MSAAGVSPIACCRCGTAVPERRRRFCSDRCGRLFSKRGTAKGHEARARAKGAIVEYGIRAIDVFNRDDWRCCMCGCLTPKKLKGTCEPNAPELDHIIPVAAGGSHTWANLQLLCRSCNGRKGAKAIGQPGLPLGDRGRALPPLARSRPVAPPTPRATTTCRACRLPFQPAARRGPSAQVCSESCRYLLRRTTCKCGQPKSRNGQTCRSCSARARAAVPTLCACGARKSRHSARCRRCLVRSIRAGNTRTCERCRKPFVRKKRGRDARRFCSRACGFIGRPKRGVPCATR